MKLGWIAKTGRWFEDRLKLKATWAATAGHLVPPDAKWWYVFGSATLMFFLVQAVTGVCLALVYVPAADNAYASLEYLNYEQPLGWMLRSIHAWSANGMVLMLLVHMTRVFLTGSFKYPRELTWAVGVFLFLGTLGMAFTGQVLRWDQDAYWGLGIGAAMTGRIPVIGPRIVHVLLGGPIIAADTLSRFFTLHVFILPGLLVVLIGLHLRLVLKCGISEMPRAGEVVDKRTYVEGYEQRLQRKGIPYFPHATAPDLVFNGFALLAMLACALYFGPIGPRGVPDPTLIDTVPRPDFWFLWTFAVLALLPGYMETFLILTAPIVLLTLLILVPFIAGGGERAPTRRPVAVLAVLGIGLVLLVLTRLGQTSPWSPQMYAWSSVVTPAEDLRGRTPLQLQGAVVLQYSQCRNCHALGGRGGERGPALDNVAARLSHDQLIRQVIQGGGNMPAYGKNLSPAEVEALVAFLQTLHPALEAPAATVDSPSGTR
jgi:ubiquinol-cytochrome c reductase cytochrome b subunit